MSNKPLYIDVHILQTVPPSCINRDDMGSPKTARYGGVRRARVSSQAWKKAIRDEFPKLLNADQMGCRTKHATELIADRLRELLPGVDEDTIKALSEKALAATGIKVKNGETSYLLFVSALQANALAQLAAQAYDAGEGIDKKRAKQVFNPKEEPTLNAADIALFGRMVADAPDLNVDATAQVAHAIGVGASESEFDYFTAMDDLAPEDNAGAGMIGTVEYLSATLYRYATLDVYHLYRNLGCVSATKETIAAFLRAFALSMPTGKQNTFANRTLPAAVVLQVRESQPVSLVGAFEKPVHGTSEQSITEVSCKRLAIQSEMIDEAFGTTAKNTYVICGAPGIEDCLGQLNGEVVTLAHAIEAVSANAQSYLETCGFRDGE